MMKGKAVVMWFFEPACPNCRALWPSLQETAHKFDGKPVLFIAVASGSSRTSIESYVHATSVKWPVLVDTSREFEKGAGITPQISLQNIHQVLVLSADGKIGYGDPSNLEKTGNTALLGATWKLDPTGMPDELRPAWVAVEFGNYPQAGAVLKRLSKSTKTSDQPFVDKLTKFVTKVMQKDIDGAKSAEKDGKLWTAYESYQLVTQKYSGFDIPSDVTDSLKTLSVSPDVKAGKQAQRDLIQAKKALAKATKLDTKHGIKMLEKVVKESPDTEMGAEARSLLDQNKSGDAHPAPDSKSAATTKSASS